MQASETYMITVACPCSQPANRIQTDAYLTNRKSREHAGALASPGDDPAVCTSAYGRITWTCDLLRKLDACGYVL